MSNTLGSNVRIRTSRRTVNSPISPSTGTSHFYSNTGTPNNKSSSSGVDKHRVFSSAAPLSPAAPPPSPPPATSSRQQTFSTAHADRTLSFDSPEVIVRQCSNARVADCEPSAEQITSKKSKRSQLMKLASAERTTKEPAGKIQIPRSDDEDFAPALTRSSAEKQQCSTVPTETTEKHPRPVGGSDNKVEEQKNVNRHTQPPSNVVTRVHLEASCFQEETLSVEFQATKCSSESAENRDKGPSAVPKHDRLLGRSQQRPDEVERESSCSRTASRSCDDWSEHADELREPEMIETVSAIDEAVHEVGGNKSDPGAAPKDEQLWLQSADTTAPVSFGKHKGKEMMATGNVRSNVGGMEETSTTTSVQNTDANTDQEVVPGSQHQQTCDDTNATPTPTAQTVISTGKAKRKRMMGLRSVHSEPEHIQETVSALDEVVEVEGNQSDTVAGMEETSTTTSVQNTDANTDQEVVPGSQHQQTCDDTNATPTPTAQTVISTGKAKRKRMMGLRSVHFDVADCSGKNTPNSPTPAPKKMKRKSLMERRGTDDQNSEDGIEEGKVIITVDADWSSSEQQQDDDKHTSTPPEHLDARNAEDCQKRGGEGQDTIVEDGPRQPTEQPGDSNNLPTPPSTPPPHPAGGTDGWNVPFTNEAISKQPQPTATTQVKTEADPHVAVTNSIPTESTSPQTPSAEPADEHNSDRQKRGGKGQENIVEAEYLQSTEQPGDSNNLPTPPSTPPPHPADCSGENTPNSPIPSSKKMKRKSLMERRGTGGTDGWNVPFTNEAISKQPQPTATTEVKTEADPHVAVTNLIPTESTSPQTPPPATHTSAEPAGTTVVTEKQPGNTPNTATTDLSSCLSTPVTSGISSNEGTPSPIKRSIKKTVMSKAAFHPILTPAHAVLDQKAVRHSGLSKQEQREILVANIRKKGWQLRTHNENVTNIVSENLSSSNVELESNCFLVDISERTLYMYEVDFDGETNPNFQRDAFKSFIEAVYPTTVADGLTSVAELQRNVQLVRQTVFVGSTLRSPEPLPGIEFGKTYPACARGNVYNLSFRRMWETTNLKLLEECKGHGSEEEQAYNLLVQRSLLHNHPVYSYHKYFNPSTYIMFDALKLIPGYKAEAGLVQFDGAKRLVVTGNPVWRAMTHESVWQLILRYQEESLSQEEIAHLLIGENCAAIHAAKTKALTIVDVDWNTKVTDTRSFMHQGEDIECSYQNYWKLNFGIELTDIDQPVVGVKRDRGLTEYIPSGSLRMLIKKQDDRVLLPPLCSINPDERHDKIKLLVDQTFGNPLFETFGIRIINESIKVNATRLNTFQVYLQGYGSVCSDKPWGHMLANVNWATTNAKSGRNNNTTKTRYLQVFLVYEHNRDCDDNRNFVDCVFNTASKILLDKSAPVQFKAKPRMVKIHTKYGASSERYLPYLKETIKEFRSTRPNFSPDQALVFLFLTNGKSTHGHKQYTDVKQWCNKQGVVTQSINLSYHLHMFKSVRNKTADETIQQRFHQVLINITSQVIHKFGELSWKISLPELSAQTTGKNIVFLGIDIFHSKKSIAKSEFESSKSKRFNDRFTQSDMFQQRRSMAACVAIIVTKHGQWLHYAMHYNRKARSEVLFADSSKDNLMRQSRDTELSGESESNVLYKFCEEVKQAFPSLHVDEVIVYRDGVASNMLDSLNEHEVSQVWRAFKEVPLTFLVLQKRIGTRFVLHVPDHIGEEVELPPMPMGEKIGRLPTYVNPPRGCIVDDIVDCQWPSFYLVPTHCSVSTVVPIRYIIAHRCGNCLPIDELQRLTYAMCFMYPNWPDSVKLPFPTQCSHKYALQLGISTDEQPEVDEELRYGLFYL